VISLYFCYAVLVVKTGAICLDLNCMFVALHFLFFFFPADNKVH
jgi:hypothetical protein